MKTGGRNDRLGQSEIALSAEMQGEGRRVKESIIRDARNVLGRDGRGNKEIYGSAGPARQDEIKHIQGEALKQFASKNNLLLGLPLEDRI